MRLLLFALLVPLAACGRQPAAPPSPHKQTGKVPSAAAPGGAPQPAEAEAAETGRSAADALRLYYKRIEARDYDAAWRMRSAGKRIDAARFAADFKAYARYDAKVGTPGRPAAADDFLYVEVPVMITGTFLGGKPFGSSGSVTLRRARGGGDWQVYTG